MADEQKLEQVFLNIMLNAIEAMATQKNKSGMLTVCTRGIDKNNLPLVEVSFVDNGPGIPEKDLDKIFTPFFTTKMRGSGLGLSVAQRIVNEHRGLIMVNSQPNITTRFTIHLPFENGDQTLENSISNFDFRISDIIPQSVIRN